MIAALRLPVRTWAAAERSPGGAPPETPDPYGAYPRLDDAQITARLRWGSGVRYSRARFSSGKGTGTATSSVILGRGRSRSWEGRHGTADEHVIGVHGRGRFPASSVLLTGETVFEQRDRGRNLARC